LAPFGYKFVESNVDPAMRAKRRQLDLYRYNQDYTNTMVGRGGDESMHRKSINILLFFSILLFLLTGCISTRKYQKLEMENQQNKEAAQLMRKQLENAINQIYEMQKQLVEFRKISEKHQTLTEKELQLLKQTHESLKRSFQKEITGGKIEIDQMQNRLMVSIAEELFFKSGKAEIMPEGQLVLMKIGTVLKKIPEKNVRIEGHTDTVPIGPMIRERYPTNWELGAARAVNVVRYLQEEVGMDPLRLSAVSYGQYRPKASNRTFAGRAKNRRIEIILIDRDLDLAKKMRENLALQ
jgi:chemotaxis protein MotB